MSNLRVLVVDDDPIALAILSHRLKNQGYTVDTAENGQAAIEKLNQQFYDAVLTDMMMPGGISGIDLLEEIKRDYMDTEVILITAHASVNTAIEAMKKGAVDYLQKPVNFDELFLRLDKIRNLKTLVKNARDLREAMDVTEKTSAETIQDLEITASDLARRLEAVRAVLAKSDVRAEARIALAMAEMDR